MKRNAQENGFTRITDSYAITGTGVKKSQTKTRPKIDFEKLVVLLVVVIGVITILVLTSIGITQKILHSSEAIVQKQVTTKVNNIIDEALISTASEYVSYKKQSFDLDNDKTLNNETISNLTQIFIIQVNERKNDLTSQELELLEELKNKKIKQIFLNVDNVFISVLK